MNQRLHFYVQPRASKNEIVGWYGTAIKVRLKAPPVDGKANAALLAFLSESLNVPKREMALIAGHTTRLKCVSIPLSSEEALELLGLQKGSK